MAQNPNDISGNAATPGDPADPIDGDGTNIGADSGGGGNGGDGNGEIEPNGISAFNPRVVILGLFLFILLVMSTNLLAKMMMADTSGRTVATVCKERLGPPPLTTPEPNPGPGAVTPTPAATPASPPPALPDIVVINTDGLIRRVISWIGFSDDRCLTSDGYLFLVVLFAGMVGATLRSIGALYWHLGVGDFSFRWTWFYLFQPFFGGALGLVFFLVLRGGFSSGTVGKGNVFTFAAVSALTGLFSENAMAKLKTVAESLLQATPAKTQDAKGSIDDGKAKKDADASKG